MVDTYRINVGAMVAALVLAGFGTGCNDDGAVDGSDGGASTVPAHL